MKRLELDEEAPLSAAPTSPHFKEHEIGGEKEGDEPNEGNEPDSEV